MPYDEPLNSFDFKPAGTASSLSMALGVSDTGLSANGGPDILDLLSQRECAQLLEQGKETHYGAGDFFFRQGDRHDGIHFIKCLSAGSDRLLGDLLFDGGYM